MEYTLIRNRTSDEGTFGILLNEDMDFLFNTIELPWRDNKPFISCIPSGVYNCTKTYSDRFKRSLYRLDDTQTAPRSAILFHAGNHAGDVLSGYKSDFEGCIGLGKEYTSSLNKQAGLLHSVKALKEFHDLTNDAPFKLTILWDE